MTIVAATQDEDTNEITASFSEPTGTFTLDFSLTLTGIPDGGIASIRSERRGRTLDNNLKSGVLARSSRGVRVGPKGVRVAAETALIGVSALSDPRIG